MTDENTRPELDQAVGTEANVQAGEARRATLGAVSDGSLTLAELFGMVDAEETDEHHLGHIHLRRALLALPRIGEERADEILEAVALEPDRHLETIGPNQRQALLREAGEFR